MRFENKVAFVTGGGGPLGIGRAACLAFAREGASVVVAGGRSADAVATEIRTEGGDAIAVPLDVTVPEAVWKSQWIHLNGSISSSITQEFSVGSHCLK